MHNNRLSHPIYGNGTILDYFGIGAALVRFDQETEWGRTIFVAPGICEELPEK
jgi:hypothetical protein